MKGKTTMSKRATINQDVILKVWTLHESAVSDEVIAYTLGVSDKTVKRIITLFTAAKNGEDIDSALGDRNARMKQIARDYFGIPEKKKEAKQEQAPDNVDTQETPSDYRDYMVRVLAEFHHHNKLIEKLLRELGVELT